MDGYLWLILAGLLMVTGCYSLPEAMLEEPVPAPVEADGAQGTKRVWREYRDSEYRVFPTSDEPRISFSVGRFNQPAPMPHARHPMGPWSTEEPVVALRPQPSHDD
jgi:hypothetical protein